MIDAEWAQYRHMQAGSKLQRQVYSPAVTVPVPDLQQLPTPQQDNPDDCGVLVVLQAERVCAQHMEARDLDVAAVTQSAVPAKRNKLLEECAKLTADEGTRKK